MRRVTREDALTFGMENGHGPCPTPPRRPALSLDQDAGPTALDALSTEVEDKAEMPLPSNPQTFFLGGLFALGT